MSSSLASMSSRGGEGEVALDKGEDKGIACLKSMEKYSHGK